MMPRRFAYLFCLMALFIPALRAQSVPSPYHYQLYGGYNWLSNSWNGVPGDRHPLNGWEAGMAFPSWHDLRLVLDVNGTEGANGGAPQHSYFIMAGGNYSHRFGRESPFALVLLGNGHLNDNWTGGGAYDNIASFSTIVGGGLDTAFSRRFAYRVQAGFQYANFTVSQTLPVTGAPQTTQIHDLPNLFARISTGLVWNF